MTPAELSRAKYSFARCKGQCSPGNKARRKDANGVFIEWKLTFDEWLAFWMGSGHWHERGCKSGQYVMSRLNDIGPYEIGNILIQSHVANTRQASVGKRKPPLSAETKLKLRNANLGRKMSEETKAKISKAGTGRIVTEEGRRNMGLASVGHTRNLGTKRGPMSQETKDKISNAKKKKNNDAT